MLNPNTVYFKTPAGIDEVKARVLGLRAELRRLLILVDGTAPLSRLAIFVRGSEIDYLITELEIQGLVTTHESARAGLGQPINFDVTADRTSSLLASAAPALTRPAYTNPEPTKAQLLAVHRAAISALHDLLGPDADALAVKIERCNDSQALRATITDIRQTLDRQMGTDTGQRFLDAVRAAVEDNRGR